MIDGSFSHAGRTRQYRLVIPPAYDGKTALPLVMVFHGGGGNARRAEQTTGFSQKAIREGFFVVYPEGVGRLPTRHKLLTWNTGNCCGYAKEINSDDVGFVRKLLVTLKQDYRIDAKRVFATGISNGGMMAYRLGCEMAGEIAAVAPVAGAMNVSTCGPGAPVSVIVFHGVRDNRVLYSGGAPRVQIDPHPRVDRPVSYAASFWAAHNGCDAQPQRLEQGMILHETYTSCRPGVGLEVYTLKNGRHAWPGGQRAWVGGDEPSREISATDLMWDFFRRHPRP
ncbi:MAG: PHB depolymerase family esterase [Candidatus Lernaella stagnicola]|nr:PHB depolymerase family esterase [Candidatus Lernaella stagnicola]